MRGTRSPRRCRLTESNGAWGQLAAHDQELADAWDALDHLPGPGDNDALDAFMASKHIDTAALTRLGTRLAGPTTLAFAFPGGIKYRDLESGRRWTYAGSEWTQLRIVRAGAAPSDTVIVAEGETDAARLSMLYTADVAVLPAGALRFTPTFAEQLASYERVAVATDNDAAGDDGAARITAMLPRAVRLRPPTDKDWCLVPEGGPVPPIPEAPPRDDLLGQLQFTDLGPAFRGEIPPPGLLVDDLLFSEGVHWVSGHPGSGKSLLAHFIAMMALNNDAEQHVLWADYEQGKRMTGQRFREFDLDPSLLDRVHYAWNARHLTKTLPLAAERWPGCVVIVDSASKALRIAGKDENSAAEVTSWTMGLIAAAKVYHLPILVIDHVSKQSKDAYARGSGAKLADTDVHLKVDKVAHFDRTTIGMISVHNVKDREGFLPEWQFYQVGDGNGGLRFLPCAGPEPNKHEPAL